MTKQTYFFQARGAEFSLEEICLSTGLNQDSDPQLLSELGIFPIHNPDPFYDIFGNPPYSFAISEGIATRVIVKESSLEEAKSRAKTLIKHHYRVEVGEELKSDPTILEDCILFGLFEFGPNSVGYEKMKDITQSYHHAIGTVKYSASFSEIRTVLESHGIQPLSN